MEKELKQHNFDLYITKLNQLGINTDKLVETIGDFIKEGSFSTNVSSGLAGDGTLINTVLKILTPYAVRLNNLYPEDVRVNQNMLVKVCLLHHIAKAVRLKLNPNEWERKQRGMLYTYDTTQPSIRTGLHSLILAQNAGINFTPEEAEAMTINDRDLSDDQARWHSSLLASIVRQANEMTYITSINEIKKNG